MFGFVRGTGRAHLELRLRTRLYGRHNRQPCTEVAAGCSYPFRRVFGLSDLCSEMHMIFSRPRYHSAPLGAMAMNGAMENCFLSCRAASTDNSA
jgi:hypothetical protein